MKRPTVSPMAIWIIEAATLKTIALRLSVVVYSQVSKEYYSRDTSDLHRLTQGIL
jgi:hypothetical protein